MNEKQAVVWFGDDLAPNKFFFRSPFRSAKFLVNTAMLVALLSGFVVVLVKNRSNWSTGAIVFWLGFLIMQGAVYPYLRVLQNHRKINELYLAGKLTEQPAESVIDDLLSVADSALNDGLFYAFGTTGLLVVFGFILHLK